LSAGGIVEWRSRELRKKRGKEKGKRKEKERPKAKEPS